MIPHQKVFELSRKSKTAQSLLEKIKTEFDGSPNYQEILKKITLEDAENILAYAKLVDEFSPSIYQIKRDLAIFSKETINGVSSDFVGMGAANLKATATALARSENLSEALVEVRKEERLVTQVFENRKNEYARLAERYLKNKKQYDFELICSGDDCIISIVDRMSPLERKGFVNYVARNSRQALPSEIRMSFVPSGISDANQKGLLSATGESIEKSLRDNLRGLGVNREKLKRITFAIEMKSPQLNLVKVHLIMGLSKDIKLNEKDISIIQNTFYKTVEQLKFNSQNNQAGESQYVFYTDLNFE